MMYKILSHSFSYVCWLKSQACRIMPYVYYLARCIELVLPIIQSSIVLKDVTLKEEYVGKKLEAVGLISVLG
ncbi:hypothetical protein XELAEV_18036039mg [Xenopus laevis]|uniref:Uncharacterized protein n=1 Tax=Xenopus laevis TaxID=8355 RepID=A0A974CGQ1_XENLA|nr:hypothetical protein XELAEV_18036039mg [Xenopus laevis]